MVPSEAAVFNDVVVVLKYAVRQPVLTHELPNVFRRIEFGRPWRQGHQGDVFRYIELLCRVPAGRLKSGRRLPVRRPPKDGQSGQIVNASDFSSF